MNMGDTGMQRIVVLLYSFEEFRLVEFNILRKQYKKKMRK